MLLSTCSRAPCCQCWSPAALPEDASGEASPEQTVLGDGCRLLVLELGWCTATAGSTAGAARAPLPASWPRSGCGAGAEPAGRAALRQKHKVHSRAGIHPARGRVGGSLADEVLF